ncbi:MAG: polysaccharide deacetylase family protein [Blastocatellia bacterium]
MKHLLFACALCAALLSCLPAVSKTPAHARPPVAREVAITIDDLPVNAAHRPVADWKPMTRKLLRALTTHKVPAIGFVNEGKLYEGDQLRADRVELLRMWLRAGLELGNHTYAHPDLHNTPLPEFQQGVLRGEVVTKKLLREKGREMRFFRHPFLHTGRSLDVRDQFTRFLSEHGYRVAPVTIDNNDYIFARAYDNAWGRGDKEMMRRIGAAYVPYMESYFDFYEKQSVALVGYEMRQTLLIHANFLNADYLAGLLDRLRARGYKFISLEQALTDKAYQLPDEWTGAGGISWLHRWALTRKVDKSFFAGEPDVPAFVMKEYGAGQ